MSQLDFLLQDVFAFLSVLNSQDIRPVGARYLPPTALAKINSLLVIPDSLDLNCSKTAKGYWQAGVRTAMSERRTERIRFLHYLAESAGLIARSGAWLKPMPFTARWLRMSNPQRAQILFHAGLPLHPTSAQNDRWRAFGLPGSKTPSPLGALAQLFDLLRAGNRKPGEPVQISTLLKLLALPAYDDLKTEAQPGPTLRAWLKLLEWFQVIDRQNASKIELTSIGIALLENSTAVPPSTFPKPQPLCWSKPPHVTVPKRHRDIVPKPYSDAVPALVANSGAELSLLWELGEYASHLSTLSSAGQTRRLYQIEAERVRGALDQGKTIAQLCDLLERATGDALPVGVTDWLHRIGRDYGRITLRSVTLLEVNDPALLAELTRSKQIRQCLSRTLSPRAVVVKSSRIEALARRLAWRGYQPRLEVQTPRRGVSSTFDQPTLAHLYCSARLVHQLADTIPTPYRLPYSILLDLERQLTEHDRAVIDELVQDSLDQMRARTKNRRPARDGDIALDDVADTVVSVETIQHAIAAQSPLEIVYYSPYQDETTTRLVEPLRLEWRDDIPYLIAYCHRAKDERTFRVDRIRNAGPQATEANRPLAKRRRTILRK